MPCETAARMQVARCTRALSMKTDICLPWHRFKFCVEDGKSAEGEGYAVESFPVQIHPEGTYVGFPKRVRKKWWGLF